MVSAIESAESAASVLRRTERLIDHLHEYPEARDYAIKVRHTYLTVVPHPVISSFGKVHVSILQMKMYFIKVLTFEYVAIGTCRIGSISFAECNYNKRKYKSMRKTR